MVKMSTRSTMLWTKLKKLSFSADSKLNVMKTTTHGSFFWCGLNEYNKSYAMIKTEQKVTLWILNETLWELQNWVFLMQPK